MSHRCAFGLALSVLLTGCVSVSTVEEKPASGKRRVISTPNAPAAIAAYSQSIQVGDTLWVPLAVRGRSEIRFAVGPPCIL